MSLQEEAPEGAIVLTGLDSCCVGHTDTSLIYSYTKLVDYYIDQFTDDGQYEDEEEVYIDAIDWVQCNIVNYKVGRPGQYIILYDFLE